LNADDPRAKWHPIDSSALHALTNSTSAPGVIYPVGTNALPNNIQQMQDVVSYFASNYQTPVVLANNMTAGAEMAVIRTDGTLGKAYNYLVATSNNGMVYFNGPHKNFPEHHFASSTPVTVESLFGHAPIIDNKPKP
jgi:hypothetical protein